MQSWLADCLPCASAGWCLQDGVGHGEASFVALHVFNLVFVAFVLMLMIVADRSCV